MANMQEPIKTIKNISRRKKGTIKSFDYFSGFGFVAHRTKEIYVHWTSIVLDYGSTLSMCIFKGKFVEYDIIQTATGIQAVNVTDIDGVPLKDNLPYDASYSRLCVNQSFYFKLNACIDRYVFKSVNNFVDRPRYAKLFPKRQFDDKNYQLSESVCIGEYTGSLPLRHGFSSDKSCDIKCENNIRRECLNSPYEISDRFEEKLYNDRYFQQQLINDQLCVKKNNKSLYHRWLTGYHSLCSIQNMHSFGESSCGEKNTNIDNAVDFLELDKLFKTHSVPDVCKSFEKWTE